MKILAFSGKKQSGKTTAVNSLKVKLPKRGEFVSDGRLTSTITFAESLKLTVHKFFDDQLLFDGYDTEETKSRILPCGKSVRELLQTVGTDWFRSLDPDCHIRAYHKILDEVKFCEATPVVVLTPDVRFPNEVKCIQDLGGHVIRLLRNPYDDKHESETALDNIESYSQSYLSDPMSYQEDCFETIFDAIIDNREMSIEQQNDAVWQLVNERGWI